MSDVSAPRPTTAARQTGAAAQLTGVSLDAYTTLRLGGKAGTLVVADEPGEAVATVRAAAEIDEPVLILAGGSNVVVGDQGFPGTVVLLRTRGSRVIHTSGSDVVVRVAAGEPWDGFVADTVANGWAGVECLSGIPGSTGATPIQNVGAYGQEVADSIVAVHAYDRLDDEVRAMTPEQCRFGYRSSVFKHNDRWVVLEVDFRLAATGVSGPIRFGELARRLDADGPVPLARTRAAVLALRAGKGMVLDANDRDTWSVGSFFTNPVLAADAFQALRGRAAPAGEPPAWPNADGTVKVSAAWLIERAGFHKGYAGRGGGRVGISGKHTLALTNRGGGTTAELLALAREIRDGVRDRFGVVLHPEPVLVRCEL